MKIENWTYWQFFKKTWGKHIFVLFMFSSTVFGIWLVWCNLRQSSVVSVGDVISLVALVISFITFIVTVVIPAFRKPILSMIIETPPVKSTSWEDAIPSSFFHRAAVINDGLLPAENCFVKLIEIRNSGGSRIYKFDPVPLYWTHQNKNTEYRPVTIFSRGDFTFIDILQEKEILVEENCTKINHLKESYPEPTPRDLAVLMRASDEDSEMYPSLRIHLPEPELLSNTNEISSPGDKPILIPGVYFLLISIYADNGFAKPEWYKLDITLSPRTENLAGVNSKTILTKVSRRDLPKEK